MADNIRRRRRRKREGGKREGQLLDQY